MTENKKEILRMNGFNIYSNINVPLDKDLSIVQLKEYLNKLYLLPALNSMVSRLGDQILTAYLNEEIKGMHTFKFTLHIELIEYEQNKIF